MQQQPRFHVLASRNEAHRFVGTNVLVETSVDCDPAEFCLFGNKSSDAKQKKSTAISPQYGFVCVGTLDSSFVPHAFMTTAADGTGTRRARACVSIMCFPTCMCANCRIRSQSWLQSRTGHQAHCATVLEPYERWKGQQRAESNHLFTQASRCWRWTMKHVKRSSKDASQLYLPPTWTKKKEKHTAMVFTLDVKIFFELLTGLKYFHAEWNCNKLQNGTILCVGLRLIFLKWTANNSIIQTRW